MRVAVSRAPDAERVVTPLELFFDLVYAFAIGQLSHHLLEHVVSLSLQGGPDEQPPQESRPRRPIPDPPSGDDVRRAGISKILRRPPR
jgi:Bacterial low temperature requirement A protein (LtrA)